MFSRARAMQVSSGMGLGAQATTGAVSSFEIKQMIKTIAAEGQRPSIERYEDMHRVE